MALFTRVLEMEEGEARALCKDAWRDMGDRTIHAWVPQ